MSLVIEMFIYCTKKGKKEKEKEMPIYCLQLFVPIYHFAFMVFLQNLSDSIDSIKLQEMFQKFGNVLSCKVVTSDDGKSRGYGFVQFESEASAKAAIEKLDGVIDGGKPMYVPR